MAVFSSLTPYNAQQSPSISRSTFIRDFLTQVLLLLNRGVSDDYPEIDLHASHMRLISFASLSNDMMSCILTRTDH